LFQYDVKSAEAKGEDYCWGMA